MAFRGPCPPSEIKKFVDKLAALAGDGGLAEALEAAEADAGTRVPWPMPPKPLPRSWGRA
jgi:hypothetical protein